MFMLLSNSARPSSKAQPSSLFCRYNVSIRGEANSSVPINP